jgi:phosphate-selective porin OprO/OprP
VLTRLRTFVAAFGFSVAAAAPNYAAELAAAPSATSDVSPSPFTGGFSDAEISPFAPAKTEALAASYQQPTTGDVPTGTPGEQALDRVNALDKRINDFMKGLGATTYPTVKVNGVFQADSAWIDQSPSSTTAYGPIKDGVDFRRARLAASGSVTETTNYFMQMDFAFFGRPTFTDLWVEQTDLPLLGTFRIGQWKQPFSLEVVSSFRYTTFVERSLPFQAFTPFRHLGMGFYNRNDSLTNTWAASVFAAGQDQFGGSIATSGGVGTAERFTWLPYYDELSDGRYYLHLGSGHFFSAPNDHSFNFRTVPELFIGSTAQAASGPNQQPGPTLPVGMPFFASTGALAIQYYNVFGNELLWVNGPLSVQSEFMFNKVQRLGAASNLQFYGGYAQVGYFLTGEHRPYDRKAGAIDRVRPFENFFRVRTRDGGTALGLGAWEVAARLSHIELSDQNVRGGRITDATAGLNWYLNPFWKIQANYIRSWADSGVGAITPNIGSTTNLFDLRCQIDF